MRPVNLIPAARLAQQMERRRRRAWMRLVRAYAVLLLVGCGAAYLPAHAAAPLIESSLKRVEHRIEAGRAMLDDLKIESAKLQARIASSRAVGDHPDWSALLESVAVGRRGEVVLESLELGVAKFEESSKAAPGAAAATPSPAAAGAAIGAAAGAAKKRMRERVTVRLAGYGTSPGAVFEFAGRLEALGLFDRVQVKDTRAQSLGPAPATHFELEMSSESAAAGGEGEP